MAWFLDRSVDIASVIIALFAPVLKLCQIRGQYEKLDITRKFSNNVDFSSPKNGHINFLIDISESFFDISFCEPKRVTNTYP